MVFSKNVRNLSNTYEAVSKPDIYYVIKTLQTRTICQPILQCQHVPFWSTFMSTIHSTGLQNMKFHQTISLEIFTQYVIAQ